MAGLGPGRAAVRGLAQPAPDAIFNALVGSDLLAFVRQGNGSGLFDKRPSSPC